MHTHPSVHTPSEGGPRRRSLPRLALLVVLSAAVVLIACAPALAADDAAQVQNVPGHDSAVMLADLGKGRAGLYLFVSLGGTSDRLLVWSGKLAAKRAKLVAGDFNTDGFTDAMLLLNLGKKGTKLQLFASDGTRFTPAATWTGKPGQIVWKSASLAAGRLTEDGKACALVSTPQADGSTLVLAFDYQEDTLTPRCLLQTAVGGLSAGTQIACGDVDKNLVDEAVAFSPAAGGGTLRVFGYDGTALNETTSTAVAGAVKSPRLACGDVNGDGTDEALLLGSTGTAASLTAYAMAEEGMTATPLAVTPSLAASTQFGTADMDGDGKGDLVALTPRTKTSGTLLIARSDGSTFAAQTAWSGKTRSTGARFSCARTVATVVKDDVHVLPTSLAGTIVSMADDQSLIVFAGSPEAVTSLAPGDVVMLEPCERVPDGLVRRVTAVSPTVGGTALASSKASLRDVFAQAQIRVLPTSGTAASGGRRGTKYSRWDLFSETVPLTDSWPVGDLGKFDINADLKVAAGLAGWVDITWSHLWAGAYFYFNEQLITPEGKHTLYLKLDKRWDKKYRTTFWSNKWMIPICGIPFWLTTSVGTEVYANVDASCEAYADIAEQFSFRIGAEYSGHWKSLCDAPDPDFVPVGGGKPTNEFKILDKSFRGNFRATAGVNLWASADFCDCLGAEISAGPYVRARMNTEENPLWAIYGGVTADLKLDVVLIGDWSLGPWKLWETLLAEAEVDKTKPITDFSLPNTYLDAKTEGWVKPNLKNGSLRVRFLRYLNAETPAYGASTAYRLDGGAWRQCRESLRFKELWVDITPGTHTLEYRSSRMAGKRVLSEPVKTATVRVDGVPPTLQVPTSDWNLWHTSPLVPVGGSDTGGSGFAGVQRVVWHWDNSPGLWPRFTPVTDVEATATAGITLPGSGVYWITATAVDGADNASASQSWLEKIDAAAPTTSVSGNDDAWHTDPVTLTFRASDPGSTNLGGRYYFTYEWRLVRNVRVAVPILHWIGFTLGSGVAYTEYSVNGGGWMRGTSAAISTAGENRVLYRSADVAGNVEAAREVVIKIGSGDTTPPTTTVIGADDAWHNAAVTLTLSATDNSGGTGVAYTEYSLNGGAWTRGTGLTVSAEGDNAVDYRSADVAGNVEMARTCRVRIDLTAPTSGFTTTTASAGASGGVPYWYSSVTFSFTAGDAGGSGVDRIMLKWEKGPSAAGPWTIGGDWVAANLIAFATNTTGLGYYRLSSNAVDRAGNTQALQEYVFRITFPPSAPPRGTGPLARLSVPLAAILLAR